MKIFLQLQTCTALVLSADCTESSCTSNIAIFDNFLVFNFPFFQFRTIIYSSFFLDKYSSIFDVVTYKSQVYHRLNPFKIPRMVYCNHRSLIISINDREHISTFKQRSNFQELFMFQE